MEEQQDVSAHELHLILIGGYRRNTNHSKEDVSKCGGTVGTYSCICPLITC